MAPQSSVNLLKSTKNAVFHVLDPKNRTKLAKFLHHFFLNHTKMSLTNFQWILTENVYGNVYGNIAFSLILT